MGTATNLKDKEYGLLTVLERDFSKKDRVYWICQCKCGTIKSIAARHLKRGDTESCGCNHRRRGKDSPYYNGVGDLSGHHVSQIKQNASKRKLKYSVSNEYLWGLYLQQNAKCALSGLDIVLSDTVFKKQTASLDRIDSSKGYEEGNVQWLHTSINKMKWDFDQGEFIEFCRLITEKSHVAA